MGIPGAVVFCPRLPPPGSRLSFSSTRVVLSSTFIFTFTCNFISIFFVYIILIIFYFLIFIFISIFLFF